MRAPLKKIFIARYVLLLEVLGFIIMGAIIAGMLFAVFHKINDDCKVKSDVVTAAVDPLTLPAPAFIIKVEAKDGDQVVQGQSILQILDDPTDVSIMKAQQDLAASQASLTSASQTAGISAQVLDSIRVALASSQQISPVGQKKSLPAPTSGILKGSELATMEGTIREGKVAEVHDFTKLRFSVSVGGKNSDRVNISLLGARDILDWKLVTRILKGKDEPENPAQRRIWTIAQETKAIQDKLRFIGPGKAPDAIGKGDVVAALNTILRKSDFYAADAWDAASLSEEARKFIGKGPATLPEIELFRFNRLLLEAALPGAIEVSQNQLQPVKAKIIVPKESVLENGKEKKIKPDIFPLSGKILTDRDANGVVIVELDDPPAELTDYMKKRLADSTLLAPTMTGGIVVGQIPMFRFLFSKE